MADYADVPDVVGAWRALTDEEEPQVEWLLGYASRKLRSKVTALDARIDAGTLDADLVRDTVLAAVLRVARNPEATRSHSETIDDHTETWVLDTTVAAGLLQFTDDELRDLAPPLRRRTGSVALRSSMYAE